jgi:hypothetical protein
MGATSRKTLGAAGTQINMHKNNTQDLGVTTKGWRKSTGTRVGIPELQRICLKNLEWNYYSCITQEQEMYYQC